MNRRKILAMKKKFQAVKQKNNGKKKTILTRAELVRVHRKDTLFSIAVLRSRQSDVFSLIAWPLTRR